MICLSHMQKIMTGTIYHVAENLESGVPAQSRAHEGPEGELDGKSDDHERSKTQCRASAARQNRPEAQRFCEQGLQTVIARRTLNAPGR